MKNFNVAFTGHRPNKLYGYDMDAYPHMKEEMKIEHTIEWLIQMWNAKKFYTGGALGFDTIVAKSLIELRKDRYSDIEDIVYICLSRIFMKCRYNNTEIKFEKDLMLQNIINMIKRYYADGSNE